jgi:uncharacterized protein YggE
MKAGITVTAAGTVAAAPDLAHITVGASRGAATVAQAMEEVNGRINGLLTTLGELGVGRDSVQTVELSVWPEHDRDGHPIGYRVRNLLRVETGDLDRVGEVVAAATESLEDAAEMHGISFSLKERDSVEAEARRLAFEAVRSRAEQLASLAGVRLGSAVAVSEESGLAPVPRSVKAMAMEAAPVEAGTTTVRVDLTIRFAIVG